MADNVFSKDPVEALVQGVSKRPGANSRAAIEGIATKSQVPANFLMAFTELSPAKSDDDTARVAQAIADKIAPRLTAGEKIEDVVRSLAGDDKTSADQFIERAYQIADDLYPDRKAPVKEEPGLVEDIGRALGGSLVRGAGGMVEAAGLAAEEASRFVFSGEEDVTGVREAAREAGDFVRQYGEGIQAGMSEEAKRAIAESTPEGNIFDPSTWSAGKNPSLKGYALLGADVLGSFLPVVATAVITKSPTATAAVGGLQGGGAGAETARDILTRAAETVGPDGRSMLERESAYYRDMLAAGISKDDALERTIAAGERMAFLMTAPVSAFGGAATSKILVPGEKALIGSGPLTRALGTAALSSLEEGTQEVAETLATRYGVQRSAEMDVDLTSGTFGDFILGALGGGLVGAPAGALRGGGRDDEEQPLALPAPDGSAPGGPLLALPAPAGPAAPKRAAPIKNALKSAPPQVVPDIPADGIVTVRAGDMPPFVGKIVRDDGVMVTIQDENGETLDVAMSQIESGQAIIEVPQAPAGPDAALSEQALSRVAPPPAKSRSKPTPDEAVVLLQKLEKQAETTGWTKRATARRQELEDIIASASPYDAAATALKEQGFYDGPWNEPAPETPAPEVAATTAGEAPLGDERTPTTEAPSGADIARFIGSFDRVAEDSGEIVAVQVTDKGPWDFNDTWPAPDAEKVAAREAEGRVEFELDDGPEAVVGVLTETLNEMIAETGFARQWEGELARIEAGEKPRFKVKAGEDPATVARRNAEEARRNASGFENALRDVWSDEAVDAMVSEANATIDRQKPAQDATPRQPEGAGAKKAASQPMREPPPAGRPTGKTYRLDNALTEAERRVVGKFRDTDGGRLIGEIDAALRRAEAQMRESGRDIDSHDENGRDAAGAFDQMAVLIREGERNARALIAEMRKKKGEAAFPQIDEDTGEPESDGSPAGNALDWLLNLEANGVAIDASDFAEGDAEAGGPEFSRKPAAEIFPPVRQTINLDALARREGEISLAEAEARIAAWREAAAEVGRTGANRDKVIVSLFDYTGAWSQPWEDAGYRVLRFDIKTGSDLLTSDWFWNRLSEIREQGIEVYGVLSACPCTTFAGSGARWWADLHDKQSPDALAKVFGEGALSSGAKSALEYNLMLVKATRDVIEVANPTGFHALENPIGRIQDAAGMPNPVARFHPYNFGDPYTKYTQLFGDFRTAMPFANVDPVEGSKMQSQLRGTDPLGKEARSTTPEGFSYAFFMANDPEARKIKAKPAPGRATQEDNRPEAPRRISDGDARQFALEWLRSGKPDTAGFVPYYRGDAAYYVSVGQSFDTANKAGEEGRIYVRGPRELPSEQHAFSLDKLKATAERPAPEIRPATKEAVQPDLLGGREKTETEMAAQERRRREWGQYLAIAEGGASVWEGDLEAAAVKVNKRTVTLKGPNGSRVTDTDGMSRSDIVGWSRWAMGQVGGFSQVVAKPEPERRKSDQAREALKPRQATEATGVSGAAAPTTAEITAAAKEADQHATQAQKVAGNYRMGHITWRGIDITIETAKGDERAGFAGDMPPVKDGHVRLFRGQSKRTKKLPEWIEQGLAQSGAKDAQGRWFTPSLAIAMWYVRDAGAEGRLVYVDVPRSVYDASRVSDNDAAIRFSRDPENENLIPREWSDRAAPTPAEPWSVKMPAHYGYIKRTTGADGDHLDVYIGDHPDSDMVVVIDQVDAKTGDFDEHKVILGTRSRKEAMDLYAAGFSDGKGGDRIGGVLVMNVQSFQTALKDGSLWNGPMANAEIVGRPTPAPAPDRSPPARAKDGTRLRDWSGVIIDGHDDTTSEDGRNSPTKNAFMRDATGYAKRVAAALRDAGFMPAKDRKGKELKPVRWNASGIATSGDVSMSLMGPDGVGIYMLITQSAMTGTRGGLTVKTNTTTEADPYGSRSMNEYPGASLTVDDMVAHMLKRVSREVEAGKARRMPTDINPMSAAAAENEAAPVGPRVFINRLTTADLLKDEGFKEGAEGRLFLKMRNEEKKTTHTYIVRKIKDGPNGAERTALQRLVQHDHHGGLPSKWLLEDAKGPDPILKAIEEDTDGGKGWVQVKSETPAKAPTLPPNFFQTYAKPMTKAEAEGTDHKPGTIKAIITRQSPFSAIDGYGATVDDALADAARKARAEIAKDEARKPERPPTSEQASPAGEVIVESRGPAGPKKPALSSLTQAEQDRAALLRARIADRMRNQLNTGLDPELLKDAVELVGIYVKAGLRRFRAMLDQVAEDMGLTAREIEPWARAAYNQARDDMELDGQDVGDMDDSKAVLAEVKALRAEASQKPAESPILENEGGTEAADVDRADAGGDREGAEDGPGVATQEPAGPRDRGEGEPETGARDDGAERAPGRAKRREVDAGDDLFGGALRNDSGRARNFVIEPGGLNPKAGEKTRARESVAAIRTLKDMGGRVRPTLEEQTVLSRYGGAGTLAGALPRSDGSIKFPDIAADLDALLTDDEKRTLSRTSQYAFYTAEPALRAMWSLAQRLGFKGGRVFEPGMGVGGFIGTVPAQIRHATDYRGIELDHVTAAIAKRLYPDSQIDSGDFIQTKLPLDYYDLAIGNPPFAGIKVQADPDYPQGFFLHDYFFAKTLDAVRPGGILMFVTSAGTMNKQDTAARDYLADRADLLGAIRLPNIAFKENGTEVTTDIIVLRKRLDGEKEADPSWRRSEVIDVPDPDGGTGKAAVNRYFIDHPEMILGEQGLYDTLTAANRIGVRPRPGSDLATDLAEAITRFASGVMSEAPASIRMDARDTATTERKAGSYYLKDGDLYQFDGAAGVKIERRTRATPSGMSKGDYETVLDLLPIRDALRDVYAADVDGKDGTEARARLNATYDAFVKKRGPIGLQVRSYRRPSIVEQETARQRALEDARAAGLDFDEGSFDPSPLFEAGAKLADIARAREEARREPGYREGDFNPEDMPDKVVVSHPNIDPFADDPESFRLRAIEKYDSETDTASKSRVFTENAVTISVQPKISSPEDALLYVLSEDGRVDLNKIADLSSSTPDTVRQELGEKIFHDPASGEWQTAARYLSGNVRIKLDEARVAARARPELQINVQALEAVQPIPIPAADIRVPIGAHWFPSEIYSQFAKSLGLRLEATFRPSLGIWTVDGSNGDQAAKNDWGTEDIPFGDMMQRIMNNKPLKVTRTVKEADGSTHTFTDETATQAANDKANELRSRFSQWFWEDQDRATDMEARYNATFNAEVAPAYDGGYLTTPGIHADWSWRPHQTAAIARFLQSGNTYLAHTVGAGKTSEMIGIAMEGRRLGIVKKPMIVVPNHMLVQFATEFYQQYPLANILVADERRFHTSRRKQFIADVALGNWDAIVITHSAFGLIPVSDAAKAAAVSDMLNDIRDVMGDATGSGDRGTDMATDRAILGALESVAATLGVDTSDLKEKGVSTRKKIERLLEAAEQRIARQTSNRGKDQVFDFDELGIDTLMVDEAHLFRKLSFATTNGAIKGIDPAGSQASMDLYIKTRALEAVNPGRSLIFASGTPITNTMAELYTISRYLQPQALADRGMTAFDAWAGSFGQVDTALEQTPDGGYKEVSRFAKFVNTPELSLMVRQVMDVVSGPDLEKYVTRPKLKRGQRTHVVVEPSQEVLAYRDLLSARMKAIENRKGPVQKGDDILLSVINDGRLSAIDMRLVDPSATGRGSKLERMVQNVYRTWKEGANAPLHGVKREGGYTDEPVMRGPSTQIVFATLGINPSKHNPDFSVHRFIKAELVRMGVPASDIILQEDLKTHALKQRAFGDMNEGRRRILVGSKTLFTGVNAQRRVAAIHNLDPLWFPADDEQRNGRGIRQGNMNPEIEIFDYSTKGTYDATMWQMMARKASFIEAFFRGDPNMREMEDLGEASAYEQAKALSTKDPRVLVLTELKADRDKLQRRSEAVRRQKSQLASEIRYQEMRILSLRADKLVWAEAAQKVVDLSGDKFAITIDGQVHTKRTEAGNALFSIAEAAVGEEKRVERRKVGSISGFPILLSTYKADNSAAFEVEAFENAVKDVGWSADPVGLMRRMEGAVAAIAESAPTLDVYIRRAESMKSDAEEALSRVKPFSEHDELDGLRKKINDLEAELLSETKAQKPPAAEEEGDKEMADLRGWTETEADPEISDESLAAIADAANKELAAHGLAGVVTVDAVRSLVSAATGAPVQGLWQPRMKAIRVRADAAAGTIGTLHHEIIHVLRSASVWRRQGGVITDREWRALIVEVARQPGLAERVRAMYPNLGPAALAEEQVAELYRTWRMKEDAVSSSSRRSILAKIRAILEAVANGLRGQGFLTAESVMRQIASGEVARRGQGRGADGRFISEAERFMASLPDFGFARTGGDVEANERGIVGHFLTNAMSGKNGVNLLALVPGRALFNELGRHIPSAQAYLRAKDAMDALRNKWQEKTDDVAQAWRKLIAQDGKANSVLMDLMHDATIAGVDPSRPFVPRADNLMKRAREEYSRFGEDAEAWALGMVRAEERKKAAHAELRTRFIGLPEAFRAMFVRVRNAYGELGDAFEQTVLDNARKAMNLGLKRAEQRYQDDLRAIDDDGLEGADREEAEERALERLEKAKKRAGWNSQARLAALRAKFESNRLDGPYFPLARFGNFFVTLRDADGKVISFSRFETEGDQSREAKRLEAEHPGGTIQTGVLSDVNSLRNQVDPNFVADVEDLIAEEVGDPRIMDMIWQRWLETLPDLSVRRSRLHRKGTPGYSGDAFRAFGRQMFHGSHQLARLKYAMDMQQNLMDARREAANAADPNRAGLVVTEMERRHGFTMNPVGSSWAQYAGTSAFIYYLAITPAAAMVNLTQTTIIGVPMLAAAFKDGGIPKAASEITKAARDFIGGRGHAQSSANLSDDEKAAMREAYDRGVVDKTQAHDLAGVAETGVEYNATWQKWMAKIAWLFHHAERMNREVTFLAGYRMGRAAGLDHEAAISKAADVTWKSHFDYQNTSRPRLMQNDYMKVLLTYRNYVINMNYRLFRDLHQMLKGETAEDRREARAQLGGITLSMMLHAGIKGTWGYALITSLLGLFADDGEDDVEEALQSALVRLFGTQVAGMMLKGVPGHLTGVDMTKRIGMPELWLRSSDRALEGEAAYSYWLSEMVGPVPGIAENAFRGAAKISDGDIFKGIEAAMPKAIRDLMKAYRYATDGATTSSGLPLVDNVGLVDAMKQALGFTPARIAEAYEANSRLINRENRIESERSKIVNAAMREVMTGELTDAMLAKVQAFNEANPDYPITGDAIRRAVSGRASAERDTVGGIRLNRRLDARLRGEAAPLIYQ